MKRTLDSDIRHLVRGELGCTCPDEVFDSVDVQHAPYHFHGLPGDCLIVIGERLLVLLIYSGHWQEVSDNLHSLWTRGRELRDSGGFNRLRIVVAAADKELAEAVLNKQFSALPSMDDRIHLHIIAPEALPALNPTSR